MNGKFYREWIIYSYLSIYFSLLVDKFMKYCRKWKIEHYWIRQAAAELPNPSATLVLFDFCNKVFFLLINEQDEMLKIYLLSSHISALLSLFACIFSIFLLTPSNFIHHQCFYRNVKHWLVSYTKRAECTFSIALFLLWFFCSLFP